MSDNNLNERKYDAINPDSIIDIKITGKFLGELRALLVAKLTTLSHDDTLKFFKNYAEGKIESAIEHELYIVYSLILGIEEAAKEQGYLIKEAVPGLNEESPEN